MVGAYYLSDLYVTVEESNGVEVDDSLFAALRNYEISKRIFMHLCAQCIIATAIHIFINLTGWTKYTFLVFTCPIIARLSGLPTRDLVAVHNFATIFSIVMNLFLVFHHLGYGIQVLKDGIALLREALHELGYIAVGITYWHAVMLPVQMLIFWLYLFGSHLYVNFRSQNFPENGKLLVILASMGDSCSTPVSLLALCITISYFSYYILTLTKVFLLGREGLAHNNDLFTGWTEGFTMLLIAIQTGLLDLKPLQRAFLMSILLFIVVSSLIQSMYEMTDPILLGLSASHSRNLSKHLRVIALCTVMWTLPLYMTYMICQYFDLDFWLMIIISSCILTSVQVIGSLLVYWLFLYDTFRTEPWEKLDDVVYYIRSTVRVLEFIVAVFVVFFGIKSSMSDFSWLNGGILMVHCYFNVWQRLQSGWKTFLLRREAVKKIESLPEATKEQLSEHNDVCSICFQEMNVARITNCGHYFHGCCLRKWLYVKDSCPLCHQQVLEKKSDQDTKRHTRVEVDGDAEVVFAGEFDGEDYEDDSMEDEDEFSEVNSDADDSENGSEDVTGTLTEESLEL